MNLPERHIYVVGDFFAKYWADRIPGAEAGEPEEYIMHTYAHRVSKASYVWDPELPDIQDINCMHPEELKDVEIFFLEDPAGYGKPFFETLRAPIVANLKLEGVVKERKRSFGSIRGKLFVRVHTTVR
jgi:hypothetical protein